MWTHAREVSGKIYILKLHHWWYLVNGQIPLVEKPTQKATRTLNGSRELEPSVTKPGTTWLITVPVQLPCWERVTQLMGGACLALHRALHSCTLLLYLYNLYEQPHSGPNLKKCQGSPTMFLINDTVTRNHRKIFISKSAQNNSFGWCKFTMC